MQTLVLLPSKSNLTMKVTTGESPPRSALDKSRKNPLTRGSFYIIMYSRRDTHGIPKT